MEILSVFTWVLCVVGSFRSLIHLLGQVIWTEWTLQTADGHWLIWGNMRTLARTQREWDTVGGIFLTAYTFDCTIRELFLWLNAFAAIEIKIFPRDQCLKPYHPFAQFFGCAIILCNGIFYLYEMSHAQMHSFYRTLKLITWTKTHIFWCFIFSFLQ